jgi:CheY-like chemotaxis protein
MTHGPLHWPAVAADQAARCAWQTTRVTPFGSTPFGRSCERARNLNIIETEDKGSGRQRGFMRALVVDDDDAFRTLVVALLAEVADVVEQAADGDVAVQLARDLRPDLIVMDITMPRMDGISAARAILAVQRSPSHVDTTGHAWPRPAIPSTTSTSWRVRIPSARFGALYR